MTSFHRAAREQHLDLLREANRKDLNTPDEDGSTPTLLAAAYGNLEALRLIVGRGGKPDKCDNMGNTALHWAAQNGHINCVSFLVHFGVNLWALDNSHRTAKEIAGMKGYEGILTFLDKEAARHSEQNKKYVQKLKDKALKDAKKRTKKDAKRIEKIRKKDQEALKKTQEKVKKIITPPSQDDFNRNDQSRASISASALPRDSIFSPSYSDLVHPNGGTAKPHTTGVGKKLLRKVQTPNANGDFIVRETDSQGKKTVTSLKGIRRDSEVLFVPNITQNGGPRKHIGDVFSEIGGQQYDQTSLNNDEENEMDRQPSSIFDRAGFGNYTFRRPSLSGTLQSIPNVEINGNGFIDDDDDSTNNDSHYEKHNGHGSDSIGSAGSLVGRSRRPNRWPSYVDDDDDDDDALEMFLTANDLCPCMRYLRREKIDLKALLLLTEKDLEKLGLPMGYGKKLLEAISRRKEALAEAREVYDSKL